MYTVSASIPPGQTVQPFAMASGKQVGRYQDVSKESQTRGHCVRIVWQIEAQRKCAFISVVSAQAKPCQNRTKVPATPWRRGQSSAAPHAPQSQCQRHTIDMWCRLLVFYPHPPMGDVIERIVNLVGQMSQQHGIRPIKIGNKHVAMCVRGHGQCWQRRLTWSIASPPWLVQTAVPYAAGKVQTLLWSRRCNTFDKNLSQS